MFFQMVVSTNKPPKYRPMVFLRNTLYRPFHKLRHKQRLPRSENIAMVIDP